MDLNKNKAFMIDRQNNVFPVQIHLYGSHDNVEENIYSMQWLYEHTNSANVKAAILSLIKTWAIKGQPACKEDSLIDDLLNYVNNSKIVILTDEFIHANAEVLNTIPVCPYLDRFALYLNEFLNEYFMRARYGGYYDSDDSSKEMVFRISSNGFNWFDHIWSFVNDNKNQIVSVTIVRDEEATGKDFVYSYKGINIDQLPTQEFLTLSGNPVIENLQI